MKLMRRGQSWCLLLMVVAGGLISSAPAWAGGPYQYFAITPCRVFDTRQVGSQTNGTPLVSPGPYTYRIQGNCGVPNGAQAVTINATVVGPTQAGDLRLFPSNVGSPIVSTLNYTANEPALANGAIVPLAPVSGAGDKDFEVVFAMVAAGNLHLLVDVTGYFQ
jgi:hypothetical protein